MKENRLLYRDVLEGDGRRWEVGGALVRGSANSRHSAGQFWSCKGKVFQKSKSLFRPFRYKVKGRSLVTRYALCELCR